jgi:ABC-type antimicrobial peptide transport system permease subunit
MKTKPVKNFIRAHFVSIAGLAVAMMVTTLSTGYIVFESSFDLFHKKADRTYQVFTELEIRPNDVVEMSKCHHQLKDYLDERIPQTEAVCRVRKAPPELVVKNAMFKEINGLYIDSDFFSIFDFELLTGNVSVMAEPNNIILSNKLACKLFGNNDCVGEIIELEDEIYTVGGVAKDPPQNTNLKFEYLVPMVNFVETLDPEYTFVSVEAFLVANEKGSIIEDISQSANGFFEAYGIKDKDKYSLKFRPISEIHQYLSQSSKKFKLFIIISLLVLFVSIVNFINSLAARSENRIKITLIRKVMGATRIRLIRGMLLDSVIASLAATMAGLIFAELFIGTFRKLSGVDLDLYGPGLWWIPVLTLAIGIITGLAAGIIPAVRNSFVNATAMVSGSREFSSGSYAMRKALVGFQYFISAGLLISLIVFFLQLRFLSKRDPGYSSEHRMLVEVSDDLEFNYKTYANEIRQIPGVRSVSGSGSSFGETNVFALRVDQERDPIPALGYLVQDGFFRTYGINIIEGRTFEQTSGTDEDKVIIDRETAKILDLEDPVGKKIFVSNREVMIIGLAETADMTALTDERSPVVYTQLYDICAELIVHYMGDSSVIAGEISEKLKKFDDNFEHNYRTVEEAKSTLYSNDINQAKIILFVGIVALIVTIVGAFTMAKYTAERRSKEISIRKILGATVREIMQNSFREVAGLILLATFLVSPVAYYLNTQWLENYSERINIGALPFILSFLALSALVFATIFLIERKAALTNPADNLRQE